MLRPNLSGWRYTLASLLSQRTDAICSAAACSLAQSLARKGAIPVGMPASTACLNQDQGYQSPPLQHCLPSSVRTDAPPVSYLEGSARCVSEASARSLFSLLPLLRQAALAGSPAWCSRYAQQATCSSKTHSNTQPPLTDANIAREDWGPGTAQLAKSLERLLLEAYTLLQQDKADIAEQLVVDGTSLT